MASASDILMSSKRFISAEMGLIVQSVVFIGAWAVSMNIMKRSGVVTIQSHKITNTNARKAFELVMWAGEEVVTRTENMLSRAAKIQS